MYVDDQDLDDALHIKQLSDDVYEVGVHIADVSYFVPPGTALDGVASKRATSTYLVHKVSTWQLKYYYKSGLPCNLNVLCDYFIIEQEAHNFCFCLLVHSNFGGRFLCLVLLLQEKTGTLA